MPPAQNCLRSSTPRRRIGLASRAATAAACVAGLLAAAACPAQDSAPSSHMVFDDNFPGDIIIHQVRVPAGGKARCTYYEALGWRGKAAGYAGLQAHPRGPNFIFSIWDHPEHRRRIQALHRGPGTKTERFGGEGTGLKSWNFELGWKTDVWYTLAARAWSDEEQGEPVSDFGCWARAGDTGAWTHLITMRVAVADARFHGRTDAFIEDWLSTGATPRTIHLQEGWKRRPDRAWHAFQAATYSVNSWDLAKGKRSFNYRTHWNGGVAGDPEDRYYFMVAGGKATKPEVKNPSQHHLDRQQQRPDEKPCEITSLAATMKDGRASVRWTVAPTSLPQFAFQWSVCAAADAKPTDAPVTTAPHVRSDQRPLDDLQPSRDRVVRFRVRDLYDNWTPWQTAPLSASDDAR